MRKLIAFVAFLLSVAATAQTADTTNVDPYAYVPQEGYFQKAYRDASDPQFMFTDAKQNFSLGVGGTVHLNALYDFCGAINGYLFNTSSISVPTDKTDHFGYTATGSNIYVKARAIKGKTKLTAYLSMQGTEVNGTNYVMLNKAYISVGGLSCGKTYSYFMDLEAGPRTVDLEGPNTQISASHNLVGYTQKLGKNWSVAGALEQPYTISSKYQEYGVNANYNKIPDFAMHAKYRGEKGHIQAGLLLRQVSYWASKTGFATQTEGVSKYATGGGVSLSGNYRPVKNLTFSAQAMYGLGVANYIMDLSGLNVDLGMEEKLDADGYRTLAPLAATGGYASLSYKWSKTLSSSIVYGRCHLLSTDLWTASAFKRSDYVAANIFYFFSSRCFLGAEYLFGQKLIYAEDGEDDRGLANRINICACYSF